MGDRNLEKNPWTQQKDITDIYFKELLSEIAEAGEEHEKDNTVYLEDELGDVLWDYIMLLKTLEKDGYIRDVKNVFTHAVEKYDERYGFLNMDEGVDTEGYWDMVKKKQKIKLKEEHERLYGK